MGFGISALLQTLFCRVLRSASCMRNAMRSCFLNWASAQPASFFSTPTIWATVKTASFGNSPVSLATLRQSKRKIIAPEAPICAVPLLLQRRANFDSIV